MKALLMIAGIIWLSIFAQTDPAPQKKTIPDVTVKDKKIDSLKAVINDRIPVADRNQEEILDGVQALKSELNKWKKKYSDRPVKYVIRTKIIHDTVTAEPPECIPDTVPLIIHDTVAMTKKQIRKFNKNKN